MQSISGPLQDFLGRLAKIFLGFWRRFQYLIDSAVFVYEHMALGFPEMIFGVVIEAHFHVGMGI